MIILSYIQGMVAVYLGEDKQWKGKERNKEENCAKEEILESQRWEKITLRVWRRRNEMESKRSGADVCFPSGWWWATAASINTCLHGSHISCFTPHPSAGPHRLRTPQRVVCDSVCAWICIHVWMVCMLTRFCGQLARGVWRKSFCYLTAQMQKHILADCEGSSTVFHIRLWGRKEPSLFPSDICGLTSINTIHLLTCWRTSPPTGKIS